MSFASSKSGLFCHNSAICNFRPCYNRSPLHTAQQLSSWYIGQNSQIAHLSSASQESIESTLDEIDQVIIHSVCWRFGSRDPGLESCIQQRKTTCLLLIWKLLACARASKSTTTNMYLVCVCVCAWERDPQTPGFESWSHQRKTRCVCVSEWVPETTGLESRSHQRKTSCLLLIQYHFLMPGHNQN